MLAAALNPVVPVNARHLQKDLGIIPEQYFNSGVLLMDINACLEFSLLEKCLELVTNKPGEMWCPDQDILNIVCAEKVCILTSSWNYMWHYFHEGEEKRAIYEPIVQAVNDKIFIMHFSSVNKPWNKPELPFAPYFWDYARYSPFYYELIDHLGSLLSAKNKCQEKAKHLEKELVTIKKSKSYRIGRIVTFIPRKYKRFVLYKQNKGIKYAFARTYSYFKEKVYCIWKKDN